jgi:two-component system, OmpR family, KDP operon response regulator KdpE
MTRILIIDDEIQIRRLLRISLESQGFEIKEARDGREGLEEIRGTKPDLVLLDLNLPDLSGLEVLKETRAWSDVPFLAISVRNAEEDIVEVLNAGADDYVVKPFRTGELVARISAALRRRRPEPGSEVFRSGGVAIDFASREVTVDGEGIKLTPTEYALLGLLARHAGRILTQKQILREVWGPNQEEEGNYLRVYVAGLRKKLERDPARPELIVTEPGVGYRLRIAETS